MNFKPEYYYGTRLTPAADLVERIVGDESSSGELETLRAQVLQLTRIVGYMASQLPPDDLKQLAKHFGWKET